jgi:hypothetical protein
MSEAEVYMSILDRLLGLVSALAYGLRRSKFAFVRLHAAAIIACLLAASYIAYRGIQQGLSLTQTALIVLCLAWSGLMLWAQSRHYVVFKASPTIVPEGTQALAPEEKLFVRGTGNFAVSKMRRYLVEVPVVFWSTQLCEHILAAKVRAWSLLGLGVPSRERGWWYIFLEPRSVIEIAAGQLCFGLRLRPALRVLHRTEKGNELLYLSCDSAQQLAILLKEIECKRELAHVTH